LKQFNLFHRSSKHGILHSHFPFPETAIIDDQWGSNNSDQHLNAETMDIQYATLPSPLDSDIDTFSQYATNNYLGEKDLMERAGVSGH